MPEPGALGALRPRSANVQKPASTEGNDSGDTWKPADNDWGYITCPNSVGPNMPAALQEYGPNGQPIGSPVVVCPTDPAPPTTAPLPPPPSPAEVWALVPLPQAVFKINPEQVGITQLPTWFWVTGAGGAVTVTVDINGYSVTTTATPVSYQWVFGDGTSGTSGSPGDASDPSVIHTYHYQGTYIVTLSVIYAGTYSYSARGWSGTVALGQYEQPALSIPYVVQQVRSVLVPGKGVA